MINMYILSAKYENGKLILEVPKAGDGIRFCMHFKSGDYMLEKMKKRRSLDSNAYAWVLIDKLAKELGMTKEEVYRKEIRDIGGVSEVLCMPTEAIPRFIAAWKKNGIGWQAETFDSKIPNCTNVTVYYGSSVYDTKQMSTLIDNIVQDCKAMGIETLPPEKLKMMITAW